MGLLLTCAVVLAIASTDAGVADKPFLTPVPPRTATVYGSGIAADTLANTQVGGTSCGCPNLRSAYRFRAGRSAALAAIRVYLVTDKAGYAGGTGGTITATLHADDGTAAHAPTDVGLASAEVPIETFPHVVFEDAPALSAGSLYHIVFTNVDPDPIANFVSIDSLFVEPPITPRQAQYRDTDWAQLMDLGDGWRLRPEYTPIMQIEYADGTTDGIGYMESWIGAAKEVSGASRVRQAFTVRGGDVPVSEIAIRVARTAGSSPLELRIDTAQGVPVGAASADGDQAPLSEPGADVVSSWLTVELPTRRLLRDFHAYHLTVSTAPDTTYQVHGIRKGKSYGFTPPTFFADGFAEYDDGTGWVAFDPGWRGPLPEADLQFYMR